VFALVNQHPRAAILYMQSARDWLSLKATVEAHEYKLPAALFEDYELINSEWRSRQLAAAAHWLHGRNRADFQVVLQARDSIRKL
jgi:hypothetical protein